MSIREIVKKRLIEEMILEAGKSDPAKYLTMVMDAESTRIATAALKMYDLCEQRITAVENLLIERAPFPELDAIYFISPSPESVAKLIEDFTPMPKKRKGPQYGGAHVFFTSRASDAAMAAVQGSPGLLHHLRSFKEVNIEFLAKESCYFSLDMNNSFHDLFNVDADASGSQLRCIDAIVGKMVTVFASLGEYPIIRYPASSRMLRTLANKLEQAMRDFMAGSAAFEFRSARGTLLLLDRATDPVAPLMHECTYQAMVHDVMPRAVEDLGGGKKLVLEDSFRWAPDAGKKKMTTIMLDESDDIWLRYRHSHMGVVMRELPELTKEFQKQYADMDKFRAAAASADGGGGGGGGGGGAGEGVELSDMGKVVKSLGDYQKQGNKLAAHVDFAMHAFTSRFMERGLMDVCVLEQSLATGINEFRKVLKLADAEAKLAAVLSSRAVGAEDKVRLLAIFAASQETFTQEHNSKFVQGQPGVGDTSAGAQDVLRNLRFLGVELAGAARPRLAGAALKAAQAAHKAADALHNDALHARYEPMAKDFVDKMVAGDLPWDLFPAVVPPPEAAAGGMGGMGGMGAARAQPMSLKPKRGAKAGKGGAGGAGASKKEKKTEGPRIIVFMAGGVTYSEIRSCYQCRKAHNRDVLVGSTNPLTPAAFVRDLRALSVGALSASGRQVAQQAAAAPLSPSAVADAEDVVVDVM